MEKEILIVDKVESCFTCEESRFRYDDQSGEITHTICRAIKDECGFGLEYEGAPRFGYRPEWCPRRPLPKKQDVRFPIQTMEEAKELGVEPQYHSGWKHGWNDCLKALKAEK